MKRFKVLYTTRITQREKRFQEGFIDIIEDKNLLKLLSISREVICVSTLPEEIPFDGSDFRVEDYLIEIDSDQSFENTSYYQSPNFQQKQTKSAISQYKPPSRIATPPRKENSSSLPIRSVNQSDSSQTNSQKTAKRKKCRDVPRTWDEILEFYGYNPNEPSETGA